jgi:hypothetical protein
MFVHEGWIVDTDDHEMITVSPPNTTCDLCGEHMSDEPGVNEAEAIKLVGVRDDGTQEFWLCVTCGLDVL